MLILIRLLVYKLLHEYVQEQTYTIRHHHDLTPYSSFLLPII